MHFRIPILKLNRFILILFLTANGINPVPIVPAQDVKQIELSQFDGLNALSGWILLDRHLFWTSDAARSWEEISPAIPPEGTIQDIEFLDSQTGWVLWTFADSGGSVHFQLALTISLRGYTYGISTPLGKAFVTINENGGNQPFEVFINTAKAGSDTAAVSEAIGRLISYILRITSPVSPRDRLKEVWRQLSGIGGGRSLGFGPNRVRSLPDGVAQLLAEYF